jgi:arylsulfatase A-like enzyme
VPDPRDVDALKSTLTPYRPPSYGTKDSVADMPAYIRAGTWSAGSVDTFRRRQLESLIGVDRSIGQLMSQLPANTLVIFTSDNGTSGASTSGIARRSRTRSRSASR